MQKFMLNTDWQMCREITGEWYDCNIPCSMYDTLLRYDAVPDPYYRENEAEVTRLSEENCTFTRRFSRPVCNGHIVLCFDGIDTIAQIILNGKLVADTDNMHCRYRFDITSLLDDKNVLTVRIFSPLRYIAEKQKEYPLWGVDSTIEGFSHIRKAHYMFGWDWGPKLPDMGIWRDVYLECWECGRIEHVQYLQAHHKNKVDITIHPTFEHTAEKLQWAFQLFDQEGVCVSKSTLMPITQKSLTVAVYDPNLWWARGYGEPYLYTATVLLTDADGNSLDTRTERIGLRTLTVRQDPDQWGESFCLCLNGKDIFAMGANWIPEDNLLPYCTQKKTVQLLQACVDANFNIVRVWGGGFYPSDTFYDFCDENGLIVWEDFMFACANYRLTDTFWETTEAELRDNILRLRNHASLGLWCGNNEIETAFETWGLPDNPMAKADYLEQFECRMPAIVRELDPQRFYWRSSPSAYGGCKNTDSNQAGDMHYWEVWHQFKPFTAFRELYYRFCSEYGFESIPSIKTLLTFCDPMKGDLNLMSPVMEAHQKCVQGNEKIMYYLAQMVRYPENMHSLIYASQLVQAECIRSAVEHMRRHRGRCMGSIYWQLNDTNPVISWSSVDYYNRWKAVHYYAKRFHAPVLLTAGAFGEPVFNVSNETMQTVKGTVCWAIRNAMSVIMESGEMPVSIPALSAKFLPRPENIEQFYTPENRRKFYLSYEFIAENGDVLSHDSSLLCVPKQFDFMTPEITLEVRKLPEHYVISVTSDVFVQAVALECRNIDVQFSDNWFVLHGGKTVYVTVPKSSGLTLDILQRELFVMHQS